VSSDCLIERAAQAAVPSLPVRPSPITPHTPLAGVELSTSLKQLPRGASLDDRKVANRKRPAARARVAGTTPATPSTKSAGLRRDLELKRHSRRRHE
jgi:hypothetical protein